MLQENEMGENDLMLQPPSRSTSSAAAELRFSTAESASACECSLPSHEEACRSCSPFQTDQTDLASQQRRHPVRSGILFVLACLTSPCCTPIVVPLIFSLIAGTPATLWLTQHGGWIYGVLTGICVLCAALGIYWIRAQTRPLHPGARPTSSGSPMSSSYPSDQEELVVSSAP
jgi:hypothetical protein